MTALFDQAGLIKTDGAAKAGIRKILTDKEAV